MWCGFMYISLYLSSARDQRIQVWPYSRNTQTCVLREAPAQTVTGSAGHVELAAGHEDEAASPTHQAGQIASLHAPRPFWNVFRPRNKDNRGLRRLTSTKQYNKKRYCQMSQPEQENEWTPRTLVPCPLSMLVVLLGRRVPVLDLLSWSLFPSNFGLLSLDSSNLGNISKVLQICTAVCPRIKLVFSINVWQYQNKISIKYDNRYTQIHIILLWQV
jgi:hypothetical protein